MAYYLILPAILVASQLYAQKLSMPAAAKQENFLTTLIEVLPWLSFLTALSSPAGIGIYWLSNSVLSLGSSIYVKDKLKKEGLDMEQLAIDAAEARNNPNSAA